MKTILIKTAKIGLITTGLFAGAAHAQEATDDLFGSPFDTCFENAYNTPEITKEGAFATAECFNKLLETTDEAGASMETILQYSASWYQTAAELGHEQGMVRLESSLLALSFLEFGAQQGIQKLASEKVFESLDVNGDNLLSAVELASAEDLSISFDETDLDKDGLLSAAEFTIKAGDATAAGQ